MTNPDKEQVTQYWNEAMNACQIPDDRTRATALAEVNSAYAEPHRHYHNFAHISQVLDVLLLWERELKDRKSLFLAAIYHDVVYDPTKHDNEERSADLADQAMRRLGIDDDRIARIRYLILVTKDHTASEDDSDAWLLLGADLSILAFPKDRYEAYRLAIRKEYGWVPERDFCTGRRRVLEGFLQRPRIFRSEHLAYLEERARANIAGEIALIDEQLRTMPS
jgi:predicted metal-dependent HD superfamily phosphohydrolase